MLKNQLLNKEQIVYFNNLPDEKMEEILKIQKTGNIFQSIGEDNKQEILVKNITKSPITHGWMGIWYEKQYYGIESNSLNTTTKNIPDYFYGKNKDGVRMCLFKDMYRSYNTVMYVREINQELTDEHKKLIFEFYKLHVKKKFETNLFEMWNAQKKIVIRNKKSLKKLFCSEFLAELLQFIGLMKGPEEGGLASKFYTPKDFINWQPDDKRYSYSEIKEIKPIFKN
jgi:hypothetical protein